LNVAINICWQRLHASCWLGPTHYAVWPHAELNRAAGGGLSQPTRQAPPFVQHPVAGHVTALWTQDAAGRPPEALSV